MTHRIRETEAVAFLALLKRHQLSSQQYPDSEGSFLFAQEDMSATDPHWSKRHRFGAHFHALHIADVLLHIDATQSVARRAALDLLTGIRAYIIRVLSNSNGVIPSMGGGMNVQLTLWSYALAKPLAYPLPSTWQDSFIQGLSSLPMDDFIQTSFSVMNVHQVLITHGGQLSGSLTNSIHSKLESLHQDIADFVLGHEDLPAKDLCALGRALVYSLHALDIQASYVIEARLRFQKE